MSHFANIFMSFYLLFLACMPCHDIAEKTDASQQIIVSTYHDSEATHGIESDYCSPLCSCACCGNQMVQPYSLHVEISVSQITPSVIKTGTKDTAGYISLLWQPPQLV